MTLNTPILTFSILVLFVTAYMPVRLIGHKMIHMFSRVWIFYNFSDSTKEDPELYPYPQVKSAVSLTIRGTLNHQRTTIGL